MQNLKCWKLFLKFQNRFQPHNLDNYSRVVIDLFQKLIDQIAKFTGYPVALFVSI